MQNLFKVIFLFLLSIFLTGCLKPVAAPNIVYYRLDATSHASSYKHSAKTLLVATPSAASGYQTADILYSLYPYHLVSYTKHRWVAPPAHMLQSLIAQSMQNTGYFAAVVTTPVVVKTDYSLNVQLVKLQQNFRDEQNSDVVLVLRAILTNNQSKVVMEKVYQATQMVTEKTPYGSVKAANLAVESVLARLARDVVNHAH